VPLPGQSANTHPTALALRVVALFEREGSSDHFCTASVVASPGRDLLITAAHCLNGGHGGGGGCGCWSRRSGSAPPIRRSTSASSCSSRTTDGTSRTCWAPTACGSSAAGSPAAPAAARGSHFGPRTRTGTIVGVIGGYQQGGDTASVSYSSYLSQAVQRLYQQAAAVTP
jgi:hypothetical protein